MSELVGRINHMSIDVSPGSFQIASRGEFVSLFLKRPDFPSLDRANSSGRAGLHIREIQQASPTSPVSLAKSYLESLPKSS